MLQSIQQSHQFSRIPGPLFAVFGEEAEDEGVEALPVGQFGAEAAGR